MEHPQDVQVVVERLKGNRVSVTFPTLRDTEVVCCMRGGKAEVVSVEYPSSSTPTLGQHHLERATAEAFKEFSKKPSPVEAADARVQYYPATGRYTATLKNGAQATFVKKGGRVTEVPHTRFGFAGMPRRTATEHMKSAREAVRAFVRAQRRGSQLAHRGVHVSVLR